MDNLYLIGYRIESGQWLEFNNNTRMHLILKQTTSFLGFDGSYVRLQNAANRQLEETRVGFHNLGYAINQLAMLTNGEIRARSLSVVIMMICESTKLVPVSDYMAQKFQQL